MHLDFIKIWAHNRLCYILLHYIHLDNIYAVDRVMVGISKTREKPKGPNLKSCIYLPLADE